MYMTWFKNGRMRQSNKTPTFRYVNVQYMCSYVIIKDNLVCNHCSEYADSGIESPFKIMLQ